MASPTPYTVLMAQIGKAEDNAVKHAKAAVTHSQRHIEARDAERASKAATRRPDDIARFTRGG